MPGTLNGLLLRNDQGEEKFFFEHQLQGAIAEGWKPAGDTVGYRMDIGGEERTVYTDADFFANRAGDVGPLVSDAERRETAAERERAEFYGDGLGNTLAATGLGAARGLTFGGTDILLEGVGLGDEVAGLREYNPTASLVGEGGAIVATSLLTGGTTGAVSAGTKTARLGRALARFTPAGAVSARTARLGQNIGGLKGVMAAEALEGAAYGTGQAISSLALSNEPLTAEAAAAELFRGGALGAVSGAVVGGGFHLSGKAIGKAKEAVARKQQALFDPATEEGQQFVGGLADAVGGLDRAAASSFGRATRANAERKPFIDFQIERKKLLDEATAAESNGAAALRDAEARIAEHENLLSRELGAARADEAFLGKELSKRFRAASRVGGDLESEAVEMTRYLRKTSAEEAKKAKDELLSLYKGGASEVALARREASEMRRAARKRAKEELGEARAEAAEVKAQIKQAEKELKEAIAAKNMKLASAKRDLLAEYRALKKQVDETLKTARERLDDEIALADKNAAELEEWAGRELGEDASIAKMLADDAPSTVGSAEADAIEAALERFRKAKSRYRKAPKPSDFKGLNDARARIQGAGVAEYADSIRGLAQALGRKVPKEVDDLAENASSFAEFLAKEGGETVAMRSEAIEALKAASKRLKGAKSKFRIRWLRDLDKLSEKQFAKVVDSSRDFREAVSEISSLLGRGQGRALEGVENRLPELLEGYRSYGKGMPKHIKTRDLEFSRIAMRQALGVKKGEMVSPKHFASLMSKEPQAIVNAMAKVDDYYKAALDLAKRTGDDSMLQGVKRSLDSIKATLGQQANAQAAKRIGWTDLSAFAGLEMVVPDMEGPIDDLAKFVIARKMAHGAKGSSRLGKMAGSLFGTAGARAGAHAGYKAAGGGLKGAVLAGFGAKFGGRAFGGLGDRIAGTQQLSALSQKLTGQIGSVIGSLLQGAGKVGSSGSVASYAVLSNYGGGKGKEESFRKHAEMIRSIASDPDSAQLAIHEALEPVRQTNEVVGDQAEMQLMRIAQFLAEKLPKDPGNMEFLGKSRWKPDDAAVRRYARYVEAVADPVSALRGVADGSITPQAAEALKVVYPETFAEVQRQLMARLPEIHEKLDYDRRVRLSVLFDAPVDSTMRPHFRVFVQQQFAQHGAQQAQQAQGMASTPTQNSESELTSSQKLLAR